MKVIHKINFTICNKDCQKEVSSLGFDPNDYFLIDENHKDWEKIKLLIEKYEPFEMVHTEFTKKEMDAANWLQILPSWHHYYPEPSDDFGYLTKTYKENSYDLISKIGKVQQNNFFIRKKPKWGNKHLLQLNWVFDEFFLKKDIFDKFFKPLGIQNRNVQYYRTNDIVENMVQLIIPEDQYAELDMNGYEVKVEFEHYKRYFPHTRGFFPEILNSDDIDPNTHIIKSDVYFGDGGSSYRAIFVRNSLFKELMKYKLKGVYFHPCQD